MRHTHECLAKRLAELERMLFRHFPGVAADCGLDAARDAGLEYIERVRKGEACELENGRAWLFRVAVRAVFKCLKREPRSISIDLVMPTIWPHHSVKREKGELARVHTAMEELPVKQKEALCLCVILGLSLRGAARELGIAAQTIDCYLEKALSRLKKALSALDGKNPNASAGAVAS